MNSLARPFECPYLAVQPSDDAFEAGEDRLPHRKPDRRNGELNLTPSRILIREAFENAVVVASAIGASTNCPPHITAIARHMGVSLDVQDWDRIGHNVPLLANIQPAGEFLGEDFHRAGGVPCIVGELIRAGRIHGGALTVNGKTIAANCAEARSPQPHVIRPYDQPLMKDAGSMVVSGNLFDSALVKASVISEDFRRQYLSTPGTEDCFVSRAIVFDGPEDYRRRIDDPELGIDQACMLVVRRAGPVGFPQGSAEVVNMTPPGSLVSQGVKMLPCLGDGRQSGASDSPSFLNASPESAAGGNLAILRTGDMVKVDLKSRRVDLLVSDEEISRRRDELKPTQLKDDSPWQQLYRENVGQLETGACLEFAVNYRDLRSVNHDIHTRIRWDFRMYRRRISRRRLRQNSRSCRCPHEALHSAPKLDDTDPDRDFMKAILIPHPGRFEFTTVDDPRCGADEVVVRTAYCGLCGTDLEILRGSMPDGFARYPVVPGHEWTGVIRRSREER